MVEIGNTVDAFECAASGGETLSRDDFAGRYLVLYFYPKDHTPGCTTEGLDFTRLHEQFKSLNADIVGVSRDSVRTHDNFCAKQGFSFDLISDPDETLCRQFDVIKEKNMYGRKVMGIERSTFIIDGDGKLVAEWRKVRVPGHAEKVLEKLKELAAG